MTITDDATTGQRTAAIAGLHELADFLAEHPDVPIPSVNIWASVGVNSLAQWVDGLTELRIEPGSISAYRRVVRSFAGLDVKLVAHAELVGESREVPTVATEFTPFTLDEIRGRAAS